MRQEAGNLSSGAISPSFDLGREHTEEASGADPARGEAPARGVKPNTRPVATGQRVLGEHSLLLNPEPLCLPRTMYIHRACLSPASTPGSGLPWAMGTCCLSRSGDVLGSCSSACLPAAPASQAQGGQRGVGPPPPPPPPPAVEGSLAGRCQCPSGHPCPFGLGQGQHVWGWAHLAQPRRRRAEAGFRLGTQLPWGTQAFLSCTPVVQGKGPGGAGAAPGMDRDPSRQRQPNPCCTPRPCSWQSRARSWCGRAEVVPAASWGRERQWHQGRARFCRAAWQEPIAVPVQRGWAGLGLLRVSIFPLPRGGEG